VDSHGSAERSCEHGNELSQVDSEDELLSMELLINCV